MDNVREFTDIAPKLISTKQACQYMGIGKNTLLKLARQKNISTKIGKRRLFDREALDKLANESIERGENINVDN